MLIGYSRIAKVQPPSDSDLARRSLISFGCKPENIYSEQTASNGSRPELHLAINSLRSGDKLVVEKLSALGYSISSLGSILMQIENKSSFLVILDLAGQSMDSSTKIGRSMFKALQGAADLFMQKDWEKKMESLAKSRKKNGFLIQSMNIELAKIIFDKSVFLGKFFCKYFYLIVAAFLYMGSSSFAEDKIPCSIQMIFTHDDYGPAAEYYLTAQVTNRTGRPVVGVSTLFYNGKRMLLGNTELDCLNGGSSLNPGSTGQCSWLLQTIDGKMMEKFGTTTWTEIVNFQLKRLDSIAECKIEGFRYKNTN